MANINYARKIEEIYFAAIKEKENSNSSSYLATELTIPVLKPIDFTINDRLNTNTLNNVIELNQPISTTTEEYQEIQIQKPDSYTKETSMRIANSILDEINKFWTNKKILRKRFNEINPQNAFSFAGYMITISSTGTVIGDLQKYITCADIKHLIFCLLKQAKNNGLVDIKQYSNLKRTYNLITTICNNNPNKKLDKKTLNTINSALEEMYEQLFKIF